MIVCALASCRATSLKIKSRDLKSRSAQPAGDGSAGGRTNCAVNYENQIAGILERSCNSCHAAGGKAAIAPFDSFAHTKERAQAILSRTRDRSMPPEGSGLSLTPDEFAKIETWISSGTPLNETSCSNPVAECKVRVPTNGTSARRLSNYELTQTIRETFGEGAATFSKGAMVRFPVDTDSRHFFDTEMPKGLTNQVTDAYQLVGETIGSYFIQNDTTRAELHSCLNMADPPVDGCVSPWLSAIAAKAFRRPISREELEDFLKVYSATKDYSRDDAIKSIISAVVQSPHFVNHLEIDPTGPQGSPGVFILNQFEMASRLSYAMWGSPPDASLLAFAERGELASIDRLKSEALRLSNDPKTKSYAKHFLKQNFGTYNTASLAYSTDFLQGIDVTGLGYAAASEFDEFLLYLFDNNKPYEDIFLSRKAYFDPTLRGTAALQLIYGVPATGWTELPPERSGVPTRAHFLMQSGNHPKPIIRGVEMRKEILCDTLPPPPPGAETSKQSTDPNLGTNERAHALTGVQPCSTCHSKINPAGYLLSSFDSIGRFRTSEKLFDAQGLFVNSVPIQTSYSPVIRSKDEAVVQGANGLTQALAKSDMPLLCLAEKRVSFLTGLPRRLSNDCVVNDIADTFKNGGLKNLFSGFITPEFLLRKVDP